MIICENRENWTPQKFPAIWYYFNASINNCSFDFIHVDDTDMTHATKSDGELATTAEHKLEGDSYCIL